MSVSFVYRYILRESCSQFDSLPLTSLTIPSTHSATKDAAARAARAQHKALLKTSKSVGAAAARRPRKATSQFTITVAKTEASKAFDAIKARQQPIRWSNGKGPVWSQPVFIEALAGESVSASNYTPPPVDVGTLSTSAEFLNSALLILGSTSTSLSTPVRNALRIGARALTELQQLAQPLLPPGTGEAGRLAEFANRVTTRARRLRPGDAMLVPLGWTCPIKDSPAAISVDPAR